MTAQIHLDMHHEHRSWVSDISCGEKISNSGNEKTERIIRKPQLCVRAEGWRLQI